MEQVLLFFHTSHLKSDYMHAYYTSSLCLNVLYLKSEEMGFYNTHGVLWEKREHCFVGDIAYF